MSATANEIIDAYKRGLEDGRKEVQKSKFPQYPHQPPQSPSIPYPQSPYGRPEITCVSPCDPTPRVEYRTDGTYVDGVRVPVPKSSSDGAVTAIDPRYVCNC